MIESEVLKDFKKLSLIIEEKQQKIVDLEAKLEKKEFAINNYWKSEKNKKEMFREKNKQLKQQLEEKEKEIAKNKAEIDYLKQKQNQTAIDKLEKVKEEFNGAFSISTQQEMFDKYIDQQIKSLKGEK